MVINLVRYRALSDFRDKTTVPKTRPNPVRAETLAGEVVLEWTNRARSAPSVEMTACGSNCAEGSCYAPIAPLAYSQALTEAARFHAAEMNQQHFFANSSTCTVVSNIASLYPASCQGQASCACVGGVDTCNPNQVFYTWLYEASSSSSCGFGSSNGDRDLLFTQTGSAGAGEDVSGGSTKDVKPATGGALAVWAAAAGEGAVRALGGHSPKPLSS